MIYKTLLASALVLSAGAASAQGFTGGYLGVEALSFAEDDNDISPNYTGGIEYGFNRNWGIAANIGSYDQGLLAGSGGNLTLHLMYHLNEDASVGLFRSADAIDVDGDAYGQGMTGIEVGYEMGKLQGEGFLGFYDDEMGSDNLASLSGSTLFGASGSYAVTNTISANASLGYLSSDVEDITSVSAGASYVFNSGPSIYAEVGQFDAGDSDSTFIGIGANVALGAGRGTTFDIRSAFDSVRSGF